MWFAKQGPALVYDDEHLNHIIIAKDISAHGHKKYGVFDRSRVDEFVGPYTELIRTHSVCRLYFDLDGGPEHLPNADQICADLIEQVCIAALEQFQLQVDPGLTIVLCSSSQTKFSKHLIFPDVLFKNNWCHMRNFVGLIPHELVDNSVYSRHRCFRMAGCYKYGQASRVFTPGLPSSALIQTQGQGLECEGTETETHWTRSSVGVSTGTFDTTGLNVPEGWKSQLKTLEPDDLLKAIHPDQSYHAFFSIGCAYKRAGGSCDAFCDWCSQYRKGTGVTRQWRGWNRNGTGYGYPFLKRLALHSSNSDECGIRLNEAFGFNVENVKTTHVDCAYVDFSHLTCAEQCVLLKSPTGTGKTTIARSLCQHYSHKRILYLVSSRALAYGARDTLNSLVKLGHKLSFVAYLETNRPLEKHDPLVCSIQSLWRAACDKKKPYSLIVCDELSSIIEDMAGVTNKHPLKNQRALRWFSTRCDRWVGLDAHLMDTSLVMCEDYFKDNVRVIVNHFRGTRKDAVFIPVPQWSALPKIRAKAMEVNARVKDVDAFRDATVMYDLMFDCWTQGVKTFFVCNNVKLGGWVEENYLRRSFTWMALVRAGLCNDLALLVTDFSHKGGSFLQRKMLKYAWIRAGDGRTGADFRTLDWWGDLDHLQYTLKICQGMDFNPKNPHFGIGFCYTTPNTAVPRRVLQQNGRTRRFAANPIRDHPTIYFAVGDRVMVKHLPVCGYNQIAKYCDDQEYFMDAVVKHHSVTSRAGLAEWMCTPEPLWRELYIRVMNERETFLRYPKESFEWWLRHDNFTTSTLQARPKPLLQWQTCVFRERRVPAYGQIPLVDTLTYNWLERRRNRTSEQNAQIKKYRFHQSFLLDYLSEAKILELWTLYKEHPGWVYNTIRERFGDLDTIITRRWGKLIPTQKNTEWTDMCGARYVIIEQLRRKLGLTELWNSDGRVVNPAAFARATRFVELNQDKCLLAFGFFGTVKKILFSWGGHKMKVIQRVRKRENKDESNTIAPRVTRVLHLSNVPIGLRTLRRGKKRVGVQAVCCDGRPSRPTVRLDESVRQIESPPWNLLRYTGIPS